MDECQRGAAHSQVGRMNVVHMRNWSPCDAMKDFNFDSKRNIFPHLENTFFVLPNHFRSSLITTPNRFTSESRVKGSQPIFRSLSQSANMLNLNLISVHFLMLSDISFDEAHSLGWGRHITRFYLALVCVQVLCHVFLDRTVGNGILSYHNWKQ